MFQIQLPPELQALNEAVDAAEEIVACQSFPDAFYPDAGVDPATTWAKAMCSDCPVRNLCAEYGLKYEIHGIWGGLSPRDRIRLRRQLGIKVDLPDLEHY